MPSQDLEITKAGVFWTTEDDPLFRLVGFDADSEFPNGFPASDRRLVYTDVNVMESRSIDRQTLTNVEFLREVSVLRRGLLLPRQR